MRPAYIRDNGKFTVYYLVGEILLTASLLTGVYVYDDFFAQQLIHKVTFSIVAWLVYAVLILVGIIMVGAVSEPLIGLGLVFGNFARLLR